MLSAENDLREAEVDQAEMHIKLALSALMADEMTSAVHHVEHFADATEGDNHESAQLVLDADAGVSRLKATVKALPHLLICIGRKVFGLFDRLQVKRQGDGRHDRENQGDHEQLDERECFSLARNVHSPVPISKEP